MHRPALVWAALLVFVVAACNPTAGATKTNLPPTPSADIPDSVVATIPLSVTIDAMAAGPEGVWLRSPSGTALGVDPATNTVVARVDVPAAQVGAIAVGSGSVWLTDFDNSRLLRIDPDRKAITATIDVGTNPLDMLVTGDAIWVVNHRGGTISKVATATNRVVATFSLTVSGMGGPRGIALAAGDLWTSVANEHSVFRLDPGDGSVVAKVSIPGKIVWGPITDGQFVYVRTGDSSMAKIDPATNAIVDGFAPAVVPDVFGKSGFWGATGRDLIRFDPATMSPSERWAVFPDAANPWPDYAIAFGDRTVWLAENRQLLRIAD